MGFDKIGQLNNQCHGADVSLLLEVRSNSGVSLFNQDLVLIMAEPGAIATMKLAMVGFQRCYDSANSGQWSELQALQVDSLASPMWKSSRPYWRSAAHLT